MGKIFKIGIKMLAEEINENILIKSFGLYSSWCLLKPYQVLFDCGDGISQDLMSKIFSMDKVFLTHRHMDHLSGIFGMIGLRNRSLGGNDKPLEIWCNQKDNFFYKLPKLVEEIYPKKSLRYKLSFNHISPGESVSIGKNKYIKAFILNHNTLSSGYCLCQKNYVLKNGLDPIKTGQMIKDKIVKRADVTERKDIQIFAYTLDNCGFDYSEVKDVKEIVLDCTFLNEKDRKEMTHCTFLECMKAIEEINCQKAYLSHISPRYRDFYRKTLIWHKDRGLFLNGKQIKKDLSKASATKLSNSKMRNSPKVD